MPARLLLRRPVVPPQRAVILKPCCLGQVMLATPLLAALSAAFPSARFDWAVSARARPAIVANPRITELIDSGDVGWPGRKATNTQRLVEQLRFHDYDTCFIPARSGRLAALAWRAGIPQRVGLNDGGRGMFNTLPVPVGSQGRHEADLYLDLARVFGVETAAFMEFHPLDTERKAMTQRLVDEIDWLGDVPLVIIHPGGGTHPARPDLSRQWPVERFVLLSNHLVRRYAARIIVVGGEEDRPVANAVAGLMTTSTVDLAGQLTLGEVGALCEMANLYVGNNVGPSYVAAACGCATLVIYGPGNPEKTIPFVPGNQVAVVGGGPLRGFSWETHVPPDEAIAAADRLMAAGQRPAT
jgi:ADP-heptose:LPS heptosyltransferase